MPYKFGFYEPNGRKRFECNLQCHQCGAQTTSGRACTRRACIGVDLCWMHLLRYNHLRIAPSTIQGAGKGLFAMDPDAADNAVVFRPGDRIITYVGDFIGVRELTRRYGDEDDDYTAPYAIQYTKNREFIDAACHRGVGSIINHAPQDTAPNAKFGNPNYRTRTITILATKYIHNGEEIFVSYGKKYKFNDGTKHRTRYARR